MRWLWDLHLFYNTSFIFEPKEVLSRTLLGHISLPSKWMELNIGGNWRQKYHIFLHFSDFYLPLQPQYIQVGETHGTYIIDIILPVEWLGMDEPVKESNNIINSHHEHMNGRNLIGIKRFIHDRNVVCAIFELSKRSHITLNFMHHKIQLSISELYLYIYLNI